VNWTCDAMTEVAWERQPSAFETGDFYLACCMRCVGYKLLDLRAKGCRRVFVFKERLERRNDVITGTARAVACARLLSLPRSRT
jgi:hypothetical protein